MQQCDWPWLADCQEEHQGRQSQRLYRDLLELLTGTQPDDLRLVFVQPQMIGSHPLTDPRDARCQTIHRLSMVSSWRADVDLCVVGIRVACESALSDNTEQLSHIQQE